jgi:hypothetical protein
MKTIILVVIIAAAFLYARGVMNSIKDQKLNCTWHWAYAICEGKQPTIPSFIDAIKAGAKFK